ncbi:MAG: hypothetical protein ACM33T_13450 [Solirubrobacterales bacterium]
MSGASPWLAEFLAEIEDDRRQLADARRQRAGGPWSYERAVERTKHFYRERITAFAVCGSVTERERDELLARVEAIG